MKRKVAIVRGKFLNRYEMQFFEPLVETYDITAFGSRSPYHDTFRFPVVKLPSPMDVPEFPRKMSILNRMFVDAHYLAGLEQKLRGFDLVHTAETYFRYTQQCLDAKQAGHVKRVIATVLENIPFNNEGIWWRKKYKQRAIRELDHIIALTQRTKTALLLEGASEEKITVVSHYVDTSRFTPAQKKKNHEPCTVLFAGRLERYKGVYELLYAAKLLISDPDIKHKPEFTFVGSGSEYEGMIAMEKRLGIDEYVSHISVPYDEMPRMYHDADIYAAPSLPTQTWQEQYNTTLLEAQASGLPIVTTASGGIPENVGDAAVVVQSADVYTLKEALKSFVMDRGLRQQYAEKARKRALTVHDSSIGAKKIADVYEMVLSSAG